MASNPFDEAFDQLAEAVNASIAPVCQAFVTLADSMAAVIAPKLEQLMEFVKFTIEHMPELAEKLHEDAGKPYGDAPDAAMRWLHDKLQEWSKGSTQAP